MQPNDPNIFEKHPKIVSTILVLVVAIILYGIVNLVINLNIIKDYKGAEAYSIKDEFGWMTKCYKNRFIALREIQPGTEKITQFKGQSYKLRTDSNGFIEPSEVHKNPDVKIFFVGGSTTECEVVDEKKRFPYLSAHIMEEKLGLKINGYNAGRSGNNTLHSINSIINKILPQKPDMIVMMENINDLSTLVYDGTYWNDNKSRSNLAGSKKHYEEISQYDEWADSKRKSLIFEEKELTRIRTEFKENLELFIAISKVKHIIPVLMTQMNRIENIADFDTGKGKEINLQYQKLYTDFQNIIREVAAENNVLLVDLPGILGNNESYFIDAVHFTNEGSELVAKTISDKLSPCVENIEKCKYKSK